MTFDEMLSLPLEKKIGQLFFIGISGTGLEEENSALLNEISPGGVCLFARNVRERGQVRQLLDEIRLISEIEPFFSVDQEGGLVDRLRRISTPMPAADSIKTPAQARALAEITGETLRILGFNMNFAPVVDLIGDRRARFSNGLQSRAFGKSKEDVIELASEYLWALQEKGILGCLKHFPGLGAAESDSHEELPVVKISGEEFFAEDLMPYLKLLKTRDVFAVMVAHAAYPKLDLQESDRNGKLLPSSLSFNFVTKLLREKLNFEGIVITDDLEMGAVVKNYGIGEACRMAVRAGADLLAVCAHESAVREGFYAVSEAVKNKEITEARIDRSLRRIFNVKTKIQKPLPIDSARLEILSEKTAELNEQIKYSYGG